MTTALIFLALAAVPQLAPDKAVPKEPTRRFPAANYSYTLPGDGWTWDAEPAVQPADFSASFTDSKGPLEVLIASKPVPEQLPFSPDLARGFHKGIRDAAGGASVDEFPDKFITFKGMPGYQAEVVIDKSLHLVSRTFLTKGRMYQITLQAARPVSTWPDVEKIMDGFAFINPAAASAPIPPLAAVPTPEQAAAKVSEKAGGVAALCLLAVLIILALWYSKKSAPKG